MRESNATGPSHGVYKISLFMVVQGAKEVWLGHRSALGTVLPITLVYSFTC
ncbi:AraC family transcriptional regulator N-terminal domain-containing protein [Paenibacillus uliginis]|uniref:AraC family transcriptional regulator N-terminal domain-containing protein n=1 Tax=Paenibacillus uliginis TaxID=683737 RepID=UPI001FCD53B9|nr:AraC family transcriptional regulator N-terminal domain-containing protein [Paenibacillus uliginis]